MPRLAHEVLDVTDAAALAERGRAPRITRIYHLAAALSASGEKHPQWAWNLNMGGLLNVLELARSRKLERVFWPSSIAAFGPSTPHDATPQTHGDGPDHRLRHQQAGRRTLVRLVPRASTASTCAACATPA